MQFAGNQKGWASAIGTGIAIAVPAIAQNVSPEMMANMPVWAQGLYVAIVTGVVGGGTWKVANR